MANEINDQKNKERPIRVGVIGLGKMGLLHASILSVLQGVELVAFCDGSAKIARFAKKAFNNIKLVKDIQQFTGLDLDTVYITTPIPSHFAVAKSIYEARIARNLFIEKTLASSSREAGELCQLSRSAGGSTMVGYMNRYAVTFKQAKALLEQSAIGKVQMFEAIAYSSDFVGRQNGPAPRGGAPRDLGSHIIDMTLWYFPNLAVDIVSQYSIDSACFRMKNHNGLEGTVDISWAKEGYRSPEFGLIIHGSEGVIGVNGDRVRLNHNGKESIWYKHDLEDNVPFLLGAPEYFREDRAFIDSIIRNKSAEPDFETAARVDYVLEEVASKGQMK
jgi:predicted dehydrogenase